MKYRLIHAEKDHHEVSLLARVLGVSRQGYYAWAARQGRGPSMRARHDAELTERIRRHHQASDEIYGAPRIHADLREIDGVRVGRKRVARFMRADGLAGVSKRKGARTTITDPRARSASDLVRRIFRTRSEAERALFSCIEGFYNPRRRHSANGQLGPAEYERRHALKNAQDLDYAAA